MTRVRNSQDERLVAAIFESHKIGSLTFRSAPVTPMGNRSTSDLANSQDDTRSLNTSFTETRTQLVEDEAITTAVSDEKQTFGAQQRNLIVDARPQMNALANHVKGAGSENMEFYKPALRVYLGIENIHVMRESLRKVTDTLKDSDFSPLSPNTAALVSSGWLDHIATTLDGAGVIARTVGIMHSHVLIHCSDGWDRTSQLSALAQICLDPYYRTLNGFITLVEKDWISFGHMFRRRSGHLNSEKWFEIENERIGPKQANPTSSTGGSGSALENAFSSAKGFFTKKHDNESSESDPEGVDAPPPSSKHAKEDPFATQLTEISPIFHQFLDATWQLTYQYPTRFEFNERFLKRLLYHVYSCQYGTFLWDSEKERVEHNAKEKTRSVWDYFLMRREDWMNPNYDAEIDDFNPEKARLIFPEKEKVRWWAGIFGRTDTEMNGHAPGPVLTQEEIDRSALVGVESADRSVTVDTASSNRIVASSSTGESAAGSASTATEGRPTLDTSLQTAEESAPATDSTVPAAPTEPEVDTDPLGAGAVFGSSVTESTRIEARRSTQMNGLSRNLGRFGINGGSGPRTPKEIEDTGTEMK